MTNKPEFLIVHHTGGTDANPLADTSHHTFKIVDAWHRTLGWEKIGYHYFIEKDGKVTQGRDDNYHGAHTKGYNEKSIGICLAGNFDATLPTDKQTEKLRELLQRLSDKYKIPKEKIFPHREFATKTCYGRRLSDEWARDLIKKVINKEPILKKLAELKTLIEEL